MRRPISSFFRASIGIVSGDYTNVPELLGQTLLEGMAAGLPAIVTRVASLPEVVEAGVTGLVVNPNDRLRFATLSKGFWPTESSRGRWEGPAERACVSYLVGG